MRIEHMFKVIHTYCVHDFACFYYLELFYYLLFCCFLCYACKAPCVAACLYGALLIKWDLMWVLGIPHVMMENMFQHEVEDATYLLLRPRQRLKG